MKFKVGDKIVCSSASHGNREGTKGEVIELPNESFYLVRLEDGTTYCDVECCFSLDSNTSEKIKDEFPDIPRVEIMFDGLDNSPMNGEPNRNIQLGLNKNKPGNDEHPDYVQVVRYVWAKDENEKWSVEMVPKRYVPVGEEK